MSVWRDFKKERKKEKKKQFALLLDSEQMQGNYHITWKLQQGKASVLSHLCPFFYFFFHSFSFYPFLNVK